MSPAELGMRPIKGFALAYVLILSMIMAIIAGGLISIMTQQYQLTSRLQSGALAKKGAEQALAQAVTSWGDPLKIAAGSWTSCNIAGWPACAGVPASCSCACSEPAPNPPGGSITITLKPNGAGNPCLMTITYPVP